MNLQLDEIKRFFASCADVKFESYRYRTRERTVSLTLIWCEGMANVKLISQTVLPNLDKMVRRSGTAFEPDDYKILPFAPLSDHDPKALASKVFNGELVVWHEETNKAYSLDIAEPPHREPDESNTEISIKGPRDGFTEEVGTNVALIRKRLRTESLHYEQFMIGKRSKTKVALLYLYDVANPDIIREARHRLNGIDIDSLTSSAQLETAMSDSSYSLFPLVDYIGRPDYAVESLVRGRFIIFTEGSPMALIAPGNLTLMLKSPEDSHFPYYFVFLERFLRLLGLIVAIFVPGFWVALVAFNLDQIPFPLLATITNSRLGIPLSAPMEMFLMLGLFELFREAGIRLPRAVGQTVAVVGGLIVGDAAIRAGIGSPTMLVAAAVTAVATFTLVNQSLSGTVSVLRLYVLILSSVFGMYGFFLGVMSIVLYVSTLESFGHPLLAPISPPKFGEILKALFAKPLNKMTKRPTMYDPIDDTRTGGESQ